MKRSFIVLVSAALLTIFMGCNRQAAIVNLQEAAAVAEHGALPPQAKIPAALVGTWRNGAIATEDFYNTRTGEWKYNAGNGMFLTIQPNSEYRIGAAQPVYHNNVETRHLLYQQGKITITGSQLELRPSLTFTEVHEASAPPHTADCTSDQSDLQPSAFAFQILQEQNASQRPMLVLTTETGDRITLGLDGL